MHPRNMYKKRVDLKLLTEQCPEIRSYFRVKLSGEMEYKFEDPMALAALTRCLLLRDHNLDLVIPPSKLVPTLPLRLNYILWIEDMIDFFRNDKTLGVSGIDVGTGASSIFALLAARKGWRMLATEVNVSSCEMARDNINNNHLDSLVTLRRVQDPTNILQGVLDDDDSYDFCMCNPPFFDLDEQPQNRTHHRKAPNNAPTGSDDELRTPGGEVQFVSKMIEDSRILRRKIKIYTSMLGKKDSVKSCVKKLKEARVMSYVVNTFQQGRTTRWALAWSYCYTLPHSDNSKKTTKPTPVRVQLADGPRGSFASVSRAVPKLQQLFESLKMRVKRRGDMLEVEGEEVTWVGCRKRRRLQLHPHQNESPSPTANKPNEDKQLEPSRDSRLFDKTGSSNPVSDEPLDKKTKTEPYLAQVKNGTSAMTVKEPEMKIGENSTYKKAITLVSEENIELSLKQNNNNHNVNEAVAEHRTSVESPSTRNSTKECQEETNNRMTNSMKDGGDKQQFMNGAKETNVEGTEPKVVDHAGGDEAVLLLKAEVSVEEEGCWATLQFVSGSAGNQAVHAIAQYIRNQLNRNTEP